MSNRAYSVLTIKDVDDDKRIITGMASTPETDRVGDVVEPKGARFKLPIPLLWQHRSGEPIGQVTAAKVTNDGISVTATIAKNLGIARIDEAWALIKAGLVRGLSIGFNALEAEPIKGSFGVRFTDWEWLELSAVTIPANQDASIQTIKSIDDEGVAASGRLALSSTTTSTTAGVSATPRAAARTATSVPGQFMKPLADQIHDLEASRAAAAAAMEGVQNKVASEGRTKDDSEQQEFDGHMAKVKQIDRELADLREMQEMQKLAAVPVAKAVPQAVATQAGQRYVQVKDNTPPGIGFARAVLCKMAAFMDHVPAVDIAKARYPHDTRVASYLQKTGVAAGTTTDTNWATELVEPTTLANEFVEYLRAQTIIGKLNLKRLPFNIRIPRQTTGGSAGWVGEGKTKQVTKFQFDAVTLPYTKVAAISVITQELARFSSPSAETIVRDQLAAACIERLDIDLIDPAKAVSSGVNPASLTNGLTALSSAGTSADNIRTDIANLLEAFILANVNPSNVVLVMPNTLALAASLMVTTNGVPQFPGLTMNGGTLLGIPVIASQYAASGASFGNMVIAIDQNNVGLADDGNVTVRVSSEASLQMDDAGTNDSATPTATSVVSMFQTNSLAILAEREIHWVKLRSSAVVYMDDVNWGAIGSPF